MSTVNNCSGNHILVGLGGTGGKILKTFKMRMFEEFPTAEERAKLPVSLLYVDSTNEMMPVDGRARPDCRVMGQDASFTNNEFLFIKGIDVEYLLDHINNYPSVKGIVKYAGVVKSAIGSLGHAAGQKRRAGRLLFAANAIGYVNSLRDAFSRAASVSGNQASDSTTIYIFAGLAGGTGSGAIIDAIVQARKTFPDAKIVVYAMMPEKHLPKADMDQGRYYQNGYAALNELNALQAGRLHPQDITGDGPIDLYNDKIHGVADGLTIYSNVNENGVAVNSLEELPKLVSDFIFARIFMIKEDDIENNGDLLRAFNFENMDSFALEFDEVADRDSNGRIPVARTKKINSFGIKRVMYPELRILKHITYTVAESALFQFKFNNWRENQGFVNEEKNKDYRKEYLNKENLSSWKIDEEHLTLEKKILPSDTDYPTFNEYWHDKAVGYAEDAKKADCPLNELDNIMKDFYDKFFRESGVKDFYEGKERVIPEMAREVRHEIELSLFDKWKMGDVSITELLKVSTLLMEYVVELRKELEKKLKEEKELCTSIDKDRADNVDDWSHLGILYRLVGKGARMYADHQEILTELYVSRTRILALEFAIKLAGKISVEMGRMNSDISAFAQKINEAIAETEKLVAAQRKVNKGLEDKRGAIIEVCEEELMVDFENELKTDKTGMVNIAREIREAIIPKTEFINFGRLTQEISMDEIKDAFDMKLAKIIEERHGQKAESEEKVLGLNILTQLQQKLRTEDDIKAFAHDIVSKSGMYLNLNKDQIQLHLRNNEGTLSPQNPASINKKVILVSIPAPTDNTGMVKFAESLENAFKNSFNQTTARTEIRVNKTSPRKNELSIITIGYCFPIRAIDWMKDYKGRYERFLNSGNPNTDENNAILLHGEGDGKDLPSLYAIENAEEVAKKLREKKQPTYDQSGSGGAKYPNNTTGSTVPPDPITTGSGPGLTPPPPADPVISLWVWISGQKYGPYNYDIVRQLVNNKQLTPETLVWKEGLANWTPASQVDELKQLFMPAMPPAGPPMPPAGPGMPPSGPAMPPM